MIMFLALMTVGFVVIHLCQGNLIVMGLVEILTGLTISPVFASGNLVVKETVPEESLTEGLSWVSTAGTMGASFGSMITGIVLDHFNPSAGLSCRRVRGLFDSVRADRLAAGTPPRLTDVRSSSVIAACLRVEASL